MYQSIACAARRGRCLEGLGCPLSLASALLLSLGWSVLAAWWPGSGVRLWTEGAPAQRWQQPRLHALCDWDRPAGHSLDCHAYADLASVSVAERAVHTLAIAMQQWKAMTHVVICRHSPWEVRVVVPQCLRTSTQQPTPKWPCASRYHAHPITHAQCVILIRVGARPPVGLSTGIIACETAANVPGGV